MKRITSSYQERKLSDLGDLYVWRVLYVIDNTHNYYNLVLCAMCYLNNFSCITHLIITTTQGGCRYYPHFIDGTAEA